MSVKDHEIETGSRFQPKFDDKGLLSAVVIESHDKSVLMVAFMNQEAIAKTRETGFAHFYSRSRKSLWMKGETSGNRLAVDRILVDCDQDALVIEARAEGPTCHTGVRSCFYRELDGNALVRVKT